MMRQGQSPEELDILKHTEAAPVIFLYMPK